MSFSPEELRKRSEAFGLAWQSFVATPNPDRLLEFAVSISSFTEFLHSKGLSGLHQISRNVEQQVLSMFEDGGDTSAPQTTLNELDVLVSKLDLKVSDFISRSNLPIAERRSEYGALTAIDTSPSHRILLIGRAVQPWQDFMLQLGYFGIDAEFHDALELPDNTTEPAIVLFDADGLTIDQVAAKVQALRARFSTCVLIVPKLSDDFDSLKSALSAGCDFCFSTTSAPSLILAKIIDICSSVEEEP